MRPTIGIGRLATAWGNDHLSSPKTFDGVEDRQTAERRSLPGAASKIDLCLSARTDSALCRGRYVPVKTNAVSARLRKLDEHAPATGLAWAALALRW
jgi:hypothetical protein